MRDLQQALQELAAQDDLPLHRRIALAIAGVIDAGVPAGSRLPSERQLCQITGASRSTVRLALDALVHDGAIDKRHGKGIFVLGRSTRRIGCIFAAVDRDSRYQWPVVLADAIAYEAHAQGHETRQFLLSSETDFGHLLAQVQAGQLDGLLTMRDLGQIESLLPTVHAQPTAASHLVYIDYDSLSYQATRALLDAGCQRPVLVSYGGTGRIPQVVAAGYRRALREQASAAEAILAPTNQAERAGAEATRTALDEGHDGIAFIDDFYALGGTRVLAEAGVEVPGQVAVAAHVNKGYTLPYPVPVIPVEVDPRDIARSMVGVLEALWRDEAPPVQTYVPPHLRPLRP